MTHRKILQFAASVLVLSTLVGCEVHVPSKANNSRLELVQTGEQTAFAVSDLGRTQLQQIAEHHERYGQTPVMLTVTYDPAVKGAAGAATRDGQRLGAALKDLGVSRAQYETLPVAAQGPARLVLVQYDALTAQPPSDCGSVPGLESTVVSPDGAKTEDDYRLGCSVETLIAKQVARPSDLAGNTTMGPYDGARASGQLEDYRKGEEFKPLTGEMASEQ